MGVKAQTCFCPDHQEAGHKCKHWFAVEYTMRRELFDDATVIETESATFTEKKTNAQNWPACNAAQSVETDHFQQFLFELWQGVTQTPQAGPGR